MNPSVGEFVTLVGWEVSLALPRSLVPHVRRPSLSAAAQLTLVATAFALWFDLWTTLVAGALVVGVTTALRWVHRPPRERPTS